MKKITGEVQMQNKFIMKIIKEKWDSFLEKTSITPLTLNDSEDPAQDFDVEKQPLIQHTVDIERKLSEHVASVLAIINKNTNATVIDSLAQQEEINRLISLCQKQLLVLSDMKYGSHGQKELKNRLSSFYVLLEETLSLLMLFKNEQANLSSSVDFENEHLKENALLIERELNKFIQPATDSDILLPSRILLFLDARGLILSNVLLSHQTQGADWVKSNARLSSADYARLTALIDEYIRIHHISKARNEVAKFYALHTQEMLTGKSLEESLETIINWANTRCYFINRVTTWDMAIQQLVAHFKKFPDENPMDLNLEFLNPLFKKQFSVLWEQYIDQDIHEASFIDTIFKTLPQENTDIAIQKVKTCVSTFIQKITGIQLVVNNPIHEDIVDPTLASTKAYKRNIFSETNLLNISQIPVASAASQSRECSLLNNLWNTKTSEGLTDLLASFQEIRRRFKRNELLTAQDLVVLHEVPEPLFHVSLRLGNPELIARIWSLPRFGREIINPSTSDSTLHVIASLASNNLADIIDYLSIFIAPENFRQTLSHKNAKNETFYHILLQNSKLTEKDAIFFIDFIFSRANFEIRREFLLSKNASHHNLLTLLALRGFKTAIRHLMRLVDTEILAHEADPQSFLTEWFTISDDSSTAILHKLQENAKFMELKILLDSGAAQLLPSEQKKLYALYSSDIFIHPYQSSGWNPDIAYQHIQKSYLSQFYWETLIKIAISMRPNFWENSKYRILLHLLHPNILINDAPATIEKDLSIIFDALIQWDIISRYHTQNPPRDPRYNAYLFLKKWHEYLTAFEFERDLAVFPYIPLAILAVLGISIYLIVLGATMHRQVDRTLGLELDNTCLSYGGEPHGRKRGTWPIKNETAFMEDCCLFNITCINSTYSLWKETAQLHKKFQDYKISGSVLIVTITAGYVLLLAIVYLFIKLLNFLILKPIYYGLSNYTLSHTQQIIDRENLIAAIQPLLDNLSDQGILVHPNLRQLITKAGQNQENATELLTLIKTTLWKVRIETYSHEFIKPIPTIPTPGKNNSMPVLQEIVSYQFNERSRLNDPASANDDPSGRRTYRTFG